MTLRNALSAILFSLLIPHAALGFEAPPTATAEAVLGAEATGPNYRVDPEVRSDGMLRLFVLRTRFGAFDVDGEDLMRERIRELGALRKLQAMSETDVFLNSAGQAAKAPLKFGQDLITDPKATLDKSLSGVANMFDRVGAGINNRKGNRDNIVTSLLGVDAAVARWASNSASIPIPILRRWRRNSTTSPRRRRLAAFRSRRGWRRSPAARAWR